MTTTTDEIKMRGIQVTRVGDAIFVPLPRAAWRVAGDGKCCCKHCKEHGTEVAHWDTLGVSVTPQGMGRDTTWMVHYPELHVK